MYMIAERLGSPNSRIEGGTIDISGLQLNAAASSPRVRCQPLKEEKSSRTVTSNCHPDTVGSTLLVDAHAQESVTYTIALSFSNKPSRTMTQMGFSPIPIDGGFFSNVDVEADAGGML